MAATRYLIVNADDYGLTEGIDRGILEAHREGIVTSASLMVYGPDAAQAAGLARDIPGLGLGLHIDFGEWVLRDGEWIVLRERAAPGDATAAAAELAAQVARFSELTGTVPDHLDSHQHVHLTRPELAAAVARVAARLGIGVRQTDPRVRYSSLYGQDRAGRSLPAAITPDAYVAAIHGLEPGITELGCHPGYSAGLESDYAAEREIELRSLCDGRVRAAIHEGEVRLITWREVAAASE